MANDIQKTDFNLWLEDAVHYLMENPPVDACIVAFMPNGSVMTAYTDASLIGKQAAMNAIQNDATMDLVAANMSYLRGLMEDDEEEPECEEE